MNSLTNNLAFATRPLCLSNGQLNPNVIGWSNRPDLDYALHGNLGRRKRWNHWCVVTPNWMFSVSLADFDYVGYAAVYFLDLNSGETFTHTQMKAFARGCRLPDSPLQSHSFQSDPLDIRLIEQVGRARLSVAVTNLAGQPLAAELEFIRPPHLDSVNLVAPIADQTFQATCRQIGLPASGEVQIGQQSFTCPVGQSFAALDFSRGVWPLHSQWTRATFAAPGGLAGNFGAGWSEASGLSENALWFGGKLSQLESPLVITPHSTERLATWQLSSQCKRVELTFTPKQLHRVQPNLGLFYVDNRQWFGQFDGSLCNPQGERVPVVGALGWLGATIARW